MLMIGESIIQEMFLRDKLLKWKEIFSKNVKKSIPCIVSHIHSYTHAIMTLPNRFDIFGCYFDLINANFYPKPIM